jgi:hypothetical protein
MLQHVKRDGKTTMNGKVKIMEGDKVLFQGTILAFEWTK